MAPARDRKDMLLDAGLTLASELSLPVVLQRIVDLAVHVTDARYGALGVIGEGERLVEFVTTGVSKRQREAIGHLPAGHGVLGLLIHQPQPVRIKNIAEHPRSVGFPANHPPMHSFLGAPVRAMGRVYGNIYLAEKRRAQEFTKDDQDALVVLATQAGVAIANASLYEEVRSRERWLDALRNITSHVLSNGAESALLDSIAEHARQLAGADAATIVTSVEASGDLVVSAAAGARAPELRGQTVPMEGSISGTVMRAGEEMTFDDVSADARAFQPIVRRGRHGPAFFVPLRVPGRVMGTLMVANLKGGRKFPPETRRLVASLADAASVALDYDHAQTELRRLGLLDERERIARELHDGIIQALFAVGMGLQATSLIAGNPEISTRLERAVDQLDDVIRDLRNYIFALRPGILADGELDKALQRLGETTQLESGRKVDVSVEASVAPRLAARSQDIVQLTREALSNVARHSHASHASVRLERDGASAVFTVEDDGVGFDAAERPRGSGLTNMRQRVAAMGGTMRISSAKGRGTTLRVRFPI